MVQQGQVFRLKAKSSERPSPLGVPVSARGSRLGEAAGRWVCEPR